jgi:hypothetical protein
MNISIVALLSLEYRLIFLQRCYFRWPSQFLTSTRPEKYTPVYSSILQFTSVYSSILQFTPVYPSLLQYTPVYSSILQFTPVYSSILQFTPVYSSILQYTPVYSSILQFTIMFILCCPVYADTVRLRLYTYAWTSVDFKNSDDIFLCSIRVTHSHHQRVMVNSAMKGYVP